ncbi:MAG: hypothetical protein ACRD15_15500 [Vicinamibacterales bacterium]
MVHLHALIADKRTPTVFVLLAVIWLALGTACTRQRGETSHATGPRPSEARTANIDKRTAGKAHLAIRDTAFVKDGVPFEWRGITAFRLAEMIAHGRERDAIAYLDWAAKQKLTIVRVLLMADSLFQLTPQDGVRAAPRLLELAAERGLHVELVALADTARIKTDLEQHVEAVGAVAAAHDNALVEVANEPWHSTQDTRLHDPVFVKSLAALVPDPLPVALGSAERNPRYAAGSYATWHSPRSSGQEGWEHVLQLEQGAKLVAEWNKPVISDEPIGATTTELIPGRRDNAPERFAAAAAVTRLAGLGATFHYEGGLLAQIPTGRELDCLTAWSAGLDLVSTLPTGGSFVPAAEVSRVGEIRDVRAAFAREYATELWVVAVDPGADASVALGGGWKVERTRGTSGVRVVRGRR